MPVPVSDLASNANENIHHAATALGKSADRRRVFEAVYTGKRRIKTVDQISKATGLPRKRVLEEGKKLVANQVVSQREKDGQVAYEKIDFFHHHKKRILALAGSKARLDALPTKRSPTRSRASTVLVRLALQRAQADFVTIDDISSFRRAWAKDATTHLPAMTEKRFKKGMQTILGQSGTFKDWGGEKNDLFTTRVRIGGRRFPAAFAFKGPATTGRLTPGKLGKNGDQIQRLFESPARVFLVQYHGAIDESVKQQMSQLATAKSLMTGQRIWYGIIDGQDSHRLVLGYPSSFN